MSQKTLFLLVTTLTASLYTSQGCSMDGLIGGWWVPQTANVIDVQRGIFFSSPTQNIVSISNVNYGDGLNGGPYVQVDLVDSQFILSTNDAFPNYEQNEIARTMSLTATLVCAQGSTPSTVPLTFNINVIDTNNNSPEFVPSGILDFTLTPPLPPGFEITGCLNDITVRDIDLTTYRIDFEIDENPYFEIDFDAVNTVPQSKEFKAVLRTKTLIRTIPETIELSIKATDVDLTDGPPRTVEATLRIHGDSEFELPEEPIFSQAFYFADYTFSDQIVLREPISLQHGYHEEVQFSLEGEHRGNFELVTDGNQLSLRVTIPLSADTLRSGQIVLVVRAEREFTSGSTSTIIVQLPEVLGLEFEQSNYEGSIVDNTLQPLQLVISQGYQDGVSAIVTGEHSSFFIATVQGNVVTITMTQLTETVIDQNNFINLLVLASTDFSTTSTVVTLEIIKDDNITPAFGSNVYTGTYDTVTGLAVDQIILVQGYDDDVSFYLEGEHANYFQLSNNGPIVSLTTSTLPSQILREQHLLLTILANKPRTVGANAAISISLPAVLGLEFEQSNYEGIIVDNTLQPLQLVLSQGYQDGVSAIVTGEHSSFFIATVQGNVVTITMTQLTETVIDQNNFINLLVLASTDFSTTSTVVTLEIIKDDNITPAFGSNVYTGTYDTVTGLAVDPIILVQGYDEYVSFYLEGEHANYFQLSNSGPIVSLTSATLPAQILSEQQLLLTVVANKPRTVGANAAISIALPAARELAFESSSYRGTLQDNILNLQTIVLNTGYGDDVNFELTGDHASFFSVSNAQNQVALNLLSSLPEAITLNNNFIMLTLTASGQHAVTASTAILLDIIKQDITTPVFNQRIYSGSYSGPSNYNIEDIILSQGFDETVSFNLVGESAQYFTITNTGSNVVLSLLSAIPEEVIFSEKVLFFNVLAEKPLTVGANAAVVINFPPELTEPTQLRFSQNTYIGSLEDNSLTLDGIILETGFDVGTQFTLTGEYVSYFTHRHTDNVVIVEIVNPIPDNILEDNKFIVLELTAQRDRSVSVSTSIIIDIIQKSIEPPIFSEAYYRGVYTRETGLQFEEEISVLQGYDETVTFSLEGEYAVWFSITPNGNSINLILNNAIPENVLENNNQLLFSIVATKPDTISTRAAISIDLPTEIPDPVVLRFSQSSYVGSIDNGILLHPTLTLLGDNIPNLQLGITGEYASYFEITQESNNIRIELKENLSAEVIDENSFIIIDVVASYPETISGYTTIVFEILKAPHIITPIFEQAYYTGEYSQQDGLLFENTISLIEGYDESVSFTLAGDDAQWFELVNNGVNSLLLRVINDEILQIGDRSHLVLTVIANKPNNIGGRAAIVISLSDYTQELVLGFERISYLGSIENDVANLEPITLSEGYNEEVTFALFGVLADYFTVTPNGATVTVTLQNPIPEQSIPANQIIVLELRASAPPAQPAFATVVFEVVQEDTSIVILAFSEAYYTGHYTEAEGLVFENNAVLTEGYDENVQFALEGDSAQWFAPVVSGNSVSLQLTGTIPAAVLLNNQQLVFVITAQRPDSVTARATIVISLIGDYTQELVLGFERISYLGSIENDVANLEPITLSEGYNEEVTFALFGDLADYFTVTPNGATVTVTLQNSIPEQSIPANQIIVLELRASAPPAQPAFATVVFEVIQEDTSIVILAFSEAYYTGHYTEADGLVFENNAVLTEGYDENVQFALEGDSAQWFAPVVSGNSVSLQLTGTIPAAVLLNNQQLVFVITAQRPDSVTARATIVISLIGDYTQELVLGFERISYLGSIENDVANLEPITLSEGYNEEVTFALFGDLADYFTVSPNGATVTVILQNPIPEQSIPANQIIVLELRASAPPAQPAFATVVFEVIQEDTSIVILAFSEAYYTGHYTEADGLVFENNAVLTEGYDENVQFALEGDSAQWFAPVVSGNSVSLQLTGTIPAAVLLNNQQLVFVITAQRPDSVTARATIVISLIGDYTQELVLGFERISYLGSIENDVANLEPITLSEGYNEEVTFALFGDLADYFTVTPNGATVTVTLQNSIPEQSIPANQIIVLELRASAPPAQPAFATVVFEVIQEDTSIVILAFSEAYYTGHYTEADGLVFENNAVLTEGYDENVQFALEGDSAQWFAPVVSGNSVSLQLTGTIPAAVLLNNQQLVFVITAQRPDSVTARATIVISLIGDYTQELVLGFERISYLGSIENDVANLEPITLSEGYNEEVTFALFGDLADYFTVSPNGATVTVILQNPIPEQSIPANQIIVLELRASAPPAQPAFATVVFEVIQEDTSIVILAFSEAYYTGHYTEADGLVFENNAVLTEGYDENVQFALEGDSAQWFAPVVSGNSVSLQLTGTIPAAVLLNNQQLVFVITAQRPDSVTARATIVISLIGDYTQELVLGFERISYLGSIENDVANLEPITLSEGYNEEVTFALFGDLADYFTVTPNGATVTVTLQNPIPEQSIPANQIIVLELRASAPPAQPAFATVVFEVIQEDTSIVILAFSEAYYTGHYTEADGLVFENNAVLTEGYDENVQFALEGDSAQWFAPVVSGNSVSLQLTGTIPAAVLLNNQQLVFVITAQRPDSVTARATIVISLIGDYTQELVLGFERISYLGSIENDVANLEPITLSEGYNEEVTFALFGDLADYFTVTPNGATVTVTLQNPIPEQSIPANQIIVLELRASAPPAQPAFATVVFEVIQEDTSIVILAFSEAYYTGHYTEADGLVFENNAVLTEGYDENVQFALEGDSAQWFAPVVSGNSVSLQLTGTIPAAVLLNNQQLVFVITAQRPDSVTARATIVISLIGDYTQELVLGFERISYLGSIENDVANLEPITLSEGYNEEVTFALFGDLADYFTVSPNGATVTVILQNPIPEQSIPANQIIMLELRASAPPAQPAFATVVFEVIQEDTSIVILAFSEAYYTGHYTEADGLVFENNAVLTEGYDENVQFALEGDSAQWFAPVVSGNSVSLQLTGTIPAAVLLNNQQLVFVITAQRPDSVTARATIVISLIGDYTQELVLGFERISYLGSIENDVANLEPITLSEGYNEEVTFALFGDLADYFTVTPNGATVTVTLQNPIPEQSIPANQIIVLELRASAPPAQPAFATVVFEVIQEDTSIVILAFSEAYYTGHYTEADGLVFENNAVLTEGYDENVQFALEGDSAQWFAPVVSGNSVSLQLTGTIPAAVLHNNQQLVFVITAQRPDSVTARATIVISLIGDYTQELVLGFERISYLGSIENDVANLEPITLSEGYNEEVTFALFGDLADYFTVTPNGATVTVTLQNPIPEQSIPANQIIVLELRASAPPAQLAFATVVFEVIQEDTSIVILAFSEAYYTGHYTEADGLVFENNAVLTEGYDENVQFALEGDSAQWFAPVVSGNSVSLQLTGTIPAAVLLNNQQLVFVITAQRPDSVTARATIVISLIGDYTQELVLGFERISYLGSIENDVANLEPITLSEGYNEEVTFALFGDLADYFTVTPNGATVTVTLQNPIPEQSIPANQIIVLELRASAPPAQPAFATVVFEVIQEDTSIVILAFSEAYYTGHYTEADGLVFENNAVLTEGYDENVQFALEGDSAQWFAPVVSGNSVSLQLTGTIPAAVLHNNQQLVFVITAQRPDSVTARATIVISLIGDYTQELVLGFERISYLGSIENDVANLEPITLSEGYNEEVTFALFGDLADYFTVTPNGATVTVTLQNPIPEQSIPANQIIVLELRASAPPAQPAFATVVFEVIQEDTSIVILAFSEAYYTGHYTEADGLVFENNAVLTEGYDENVQFALEGDSAQWFAPVVSGNSVSLQLTGTIPAAVLLNNQQLVFVITAQRPDSVTARATIVISLIGDYTQELVLGFERISYLGSIENDVANLEPITLSEGYNEEVTFAMFGDLADYFTVSANGATVTVILQNPIPEQSIPANQIIVLELRASAPPAQPAFATVVFEVIQEDTSIVILAFSEAYYTGHYTEADGLVFENNAVLTEGYDENVQFALEGDSAQWFAPVVSGNSVSLQLTGTIPAAVLHNNQQLVFVITAQRPDSVTARATIVISLIGDYTQELVLGFERISYLGSIENDVANLEPITLSEGYNEEVTFALFGDLADYFTVSPNGATVTVTLQNPIPEQSIPANQIIVLELRASAPPAQPAFATVVFEVIQEDTSIVILAFSEAYYTGHYTEADGLVFENNAVLTEGYDENVQFALEGDSAQWFAPVVSGNSVSLQLTGSIPPAVLLNNQQLVFVLTAQRPDSVTARATIVISLIGDGQSGSEVTFDKVLYQGIIQAGAVQHETITISEYDGIVEILGEFAELFAAINSDGIVNVNGLEDVTISDEVTYLALELRAGGAGAVLLLDIIHSVNPVLPSVTFGSESYLMRVYISHTGLVGRVQATADNGESVSYSLNVDNDHLLQRLSIDNEGEIHLSAPANSGVYNFQVIATSVFTQVTGAAQVHLTVDAITVCGEDNLVLPPLIILDRDEEEPLSNLVVLSEEFENCHYSLTNRWPIDQTWLYVNENGLQANAIDREHESIAFMALSQVQVELILECDGDDAVTRSKRSITEMRQHSLGPYDYGNNKWILSDSIMYNSRRTLVNLIVNDINDNSPIFVGWENQPITVGYPVPELEQRVLPRALIELQATDADVGENAALRFGSSEEVLAVSPSTGFVHIRHNAQLEDNMPLTVFVTDRNGEADGRTSFLQLVVKLLDVSHIAVVTVRDAFLDNEETILMELSNAVGYEIKVLRSTVVSEDAETNISDPESRRKRDVTNGDGASMQLYIYGLIDREPVAVEQLTADINSNAVTTVSIASTISLEDHLESLEICPVPGRDTGLLVATIVLSVLLFILIVAAAVWFFLLWRKKQNYQQFSDANSLESRNESVSQPPKIEVVSKPQPRLNIEELRKSERRLQEMLEVPIDEVTVEPSTSRQDTSANPVVNISMPDPQLPIVIQSIDRLKDAGDESEGEEDEFGERIRSKRKSVVTFNENVEKIIHVEDPPDDASSVDYEVYKL